MSDLKELLANAIYEAIAEEDVDQLVDRILGVLAEREISDEEIDAAFNALAPVMFGRTDQVKREIVGNALVAARRFWLEGHKK